MNDAFCEQIVARKKRPIDYVVSGVILVLIATLIIFPFLGLFSFILVLVLVAFEVFYFIRKMNIEYEYSLLNHDMEITEIYKQRYRKPRVSFDFQKAEMIAPKGSGHLRSFHPAKTFDYTSGTDSSNVYCIMMNDPSGLICYEIEPDSDVLPHLRSWMGSKMYME